MKKIETTVVELDARVKVAVESARARIACVLMVGAEYLKAIKAEGLEDREWERKICNLPSHPEGAYIMLRPEGKVGVTVYGSTYVKPCMMAPWSAVTAGELDACMTEAVVLTRIIVDSVTKCLAARRAAAEDLIARLDACAVIPAEFALPATGEVNEEEDEDAR